MVALRMVLRFGIVLVGMVVVTLAIPLENRLTGNSAYAGRVFEGKLRYERVIASRKWHVWGAEGWDCTFAIVDLAEPVRPLPPRSPQSGERSFLRFGGDWKPTPVEPIGVSARDALGYCGQYFDDDTKLRLNAALTAPGSWYDRDHVGETLAIYSPAQRIAARIRYGD